MNHRTRWLCWSCCGVGSVPHGTERGIVRMTCDECDGRGWYTDQTGKPPSPMTLAQHLHEERLRAATCGECRHFNPKREGRPGACTYGADSGNEAYTRFPRVAGEEACRAGLRPEPPRAVVLARPASFGLTQEAP